MAFALGLSVLLAKDFVVVIDAVMAGTIPALSAARRKRKTSIWELP